MTDTIENLQALCDQYEQLCQLKDSELQHARAEVERLNKGIALVEDDRQAWIKECNDSVAERARLRSECAAMRALLTEAPEPQQIGRIGREKWNVPGRAYADWHARVAKELE